MQHTPQLYLNHRQYQPNAEPNTSFRLPDSQNTAKSYGPLTLCSIFQWVNKADHKRHTNQLHSNANNTSPFITCAFVTTDIVLRVHKASKILRWHRCTGLTQPPMKHVVPQAREAASICDVAYMLQMNFIKTLPFLWTYTSLFRCTVCIALKTRC